MQKLLLKIKSTIFIVVLSLFVMPQQIKAHDIGISGWNNDDITISWDQNRGAFYFTITIYDWAGADEWLSYVYIACDDQNFVCFDSWFSSSSSTASYRVIGQNNYGKTYHANYTAIKNDVWTNHNVNDDGNDRGRMGFYWYPPTDKLNKTLTFKVHGTTRDSDEDSWYKSATITTSSPTHTYTPMLENAGWDLNTGAFKVKLTKLENGNKHSTTRSTILLRTKIENGDWTNRNYTYTTTNQQATINKTWSETGYILYSDYNNTTELTAQQFAEGVSFGATAITDPKIAP